MNVIITGASRGIGFQTVQVFASHKGNRIFALARSRKPLVQLSQYCGREFKDSEVIPIPHDLNDLESGGRELLEKISLYTESIDILINNAGALINDPFLDVTWEQAIGLFKTNIMGPAQLIRLFIPMLRKSDLAHVVNIGSMSGFQGSVKFPGLAYYSASKAAISALTECLATEFDDRKIRFNCLAIGSVATEMLAEAFPGFKASLTPQEMGKYIHDFATTGHKYYNGKVLPVTIGTP